MRAILGLLFVRTLGRPGGGLSALDPPVPEAATTGSAWTPLPAAARDLIATARVVIVEDLPPNVALLERMMKAIGVGEVTSVSDPRDAVAQSVAAAADLVLLDWHMPGMDGAAVLTGLRRAFPPEVYLPVIVLTADESSAVRDRALSLGANDFLTKPFDLSEVALRVHNLLATRALHQQVYRANTGLRADLDRRAEKERREAAEHAAKARRVDAAFAEDALSMVFQPIVNLRTKEVLGVEALARFACEPARPPNEWFDEARDVGRALELELAAIRMALDALDEFPVDDFMSVNVSAETIAAPAFEELLQRYPGHRVVLELTEHSVVDEYAALTASLDALRERGVRIAVDDMGAGYSGLRHVLRLRPDILKLDIALTQDIGEDPARRALATALVTFAREVRATIVAEGIETAAELETLSRLGVHLGQGYHLGRPAPAGATPSGAIP